MKYTLKLIQKFPFPDNVPLVDLEGDKILLNDVMLPTHIDRENSYNPNDIKLYVIGHEFGAICAVWAGYTQEAFDNAVDCNMLDCLMSEEQDYDDESLTPLGNASELFDLSYAWIAQVEFDPARDIQLIVAIVRGSENQQDTLEN